MYQKNSVREINGLGTRFENEEFLQMFDSKCNNGIVGLFCEGYGCYYNRDCFNGNCNMYSKCQAKQKPFYIKDMENQLDNAVKGLDNNSTAQI